MRSIQYFLFMILVIMTISACAPQKGDKGDTVVGPVGERGVPGESIVGNPGADGQNGSDGVDATPTTIIRLCPGFTQYNSTFVEVALCIQNRLYGVYSANGGFMTEIVPGTYLSEGINNTCTLVVGSNCQVTW